MSTAFVTWFSSEDYLPGILALNASLRWFHPEKRLIVLMAGRISDEVVKTLSKAGCRLQQVEEIARPSNIGPSNFNHYTKLRVFELTEFDKILFLDADMIICEDLSELFNLPHMSSVVAGGLVKPETWVDLNGGLLVIKPSKMLFDEMLGKINSLPSSDGSDQGFLQSFYPDWAQQKELHLDHRFNVPVPYLDRYCEDFGFIFEYSDGVLETNVSVLHFWGPVKPWLFDIENPSPLNPTKYLQSIRLWYDFHLLAVQEIRLLEKF